MKINENDERKPFFDNIFNISAYYYLCVWLFSWTQTRTSRHTLAWSTSLTFFGGFKCVKTHVNIQSETKSSKPIGETGGRSQNWSIVCNGLEVIKNIIPSLIKVGHLVFTHKKEFSRAQKSMTSWEVSQWSSLIYVIVWRKTGFECSRPHSAILH